MKNPPLALLIGLGTLLLAGCASLDLSPESNPSRVAQGTVNFPGGIPAGAEVLVRIVEPAGHEETPPPALDLPVADRPKPPPTEHVLGSQMQTLAQGAVQSVPFQVAFEADDDTLRRGLNIDARISYGGRLRFRTVNAHVVTLAAIPFQQQVWVQPVQ